MTKEIVKAWPITEGQAFRVSGRQGAKAAKPMASCGKKKYSRFYSTLFRGGGFAIRNAAIPVISRT